jgi:hypothetical protein
MPVPCLSGGLPIFVLFHSHDCERRVHAKGDRVGVLSVLRFIPIGVFDDATMRGMAGRSMPRAKNLMTQGSRPWSTKSCSNGLSRPRKEANGT